MAKQLYRVEAPHFTAHVVVDRESRKIIEFAPILAWCKGSAIDQIIAYCNRKMWKIDCIDSVE